MLRWLAGFDRLVSASRPAWGWVGELALVVLGVHLAADRLDDLLLGWVAPLPVAWPTEDFALGLSTWTAVAVELYAVGWAAWTLLRSRAEPVASRRDWLERASVHAVVAPLCWIPLALAGAWVVAMALEDAAVPWVGEPATWAAWALAALVAWRLGWSGWSRVALRAPVPQKRLDGLFATLPIVLVGALAARYGLPLYTVLEPAVAAAWPAVVGWAP